MTSAPAATADERKELLGRHIALAVQNGARVGSQSDFQAVLVFGHRVNHVLHLLVGLVTVGVWWIAWLLLALRGGEKRIAMTVDQAGRIERVESR